MTALCGRSLIGLSQMSRPDTSVEVMFGLPFSTMDLAESVTALAGEIFTGEGSSRIVVTPNVHHVVRLSRDDDLKQLYLEADYIFPDGQPLVWLSKMTGGMLRRRVTGADLLPLICDEVEKREGEIFILGGFPGDEEKITGLFGRRFPRLKVNVHSPPAGFNPAGGDGEEAVRAVRQHSPDAVFVCLGMPKQEIWSFAAKEKLDRTVFFCVGAALDYLTGAYARAPRPFPAIKALSGPNISCVFLTNRSSGCRPSAQP